MVLVAVCSGATFTVLQLNAFLTVHVLLGAYTFTFYTFQVLFPLATLGALPPPYFFLLAIVLAALGAFLQHRTFRVGGETASMLAKLSCAGEEYVIGS